MSWEEIFCLFVLDLYRAGNAPYAIGRRLGISSAEASRAITRAEEMGF